MQHQALLSETYPVNSVISVTLTTSEVLEGTVYTTDEFSSSIVLRIALPHTTLSSEMRIIHASAVSSCRIVKQEAENSSNALSVPLSAVSQKSLEEREKRAILLAEESFGHINEKASPQGQAVFDRLVKACNQVVWKGESILVLNQVRVDPPYGRNNCQLVATTGNLDKGSLERVQKIVAG